MIKYASNSHGFAVWHTHDKISLQGFFKSWQLWDMCFRLNETVKHSAPRRPWSIRSFSHWLSSLTLLGPSTDSASGNRFLRHQSNLLPLNNILPCCKGERFIWSEEKQVFWAWTDLLNCMSDSTTYWQQEVSLVFQLEFDLHKMFALCSALDGVDRNAWLVGVVRRCVTDTGSAYPSRGAQNSRNAEPFRPVPDRPPLSHIRSRVRKCLCPLSAAS